MTRSPLAELRYIVSVLDSYTAAHVTMSELREINRWTKIRSEEEASAVLQQARKVHAKVLTVDMKLLQALTDLRNLHNLSLGFQLWKSAF